MEYKDKAKKVYIACCLLIIISCVLNAIQFPRPQGLVNDFAGVMEPSTRETLTRILSDLQRKTGVDIAIVTVKDLQGLDIDTYATDLFATWGIGSRNDEGVLILLATDDREIKVEVGYGSEAYLTDGMTGQILDQYVIPLLAQDDFNRGLLNAGIAFASFIAQVKNIELEETGTARTSQQNAPVEEYEINPIALLIFVGIMVLLIIVTRGRIIWWILMILSMSGRGGGHRGGSGRSGGFGGGRSGGGGARRRF
jgi:uncharacterized protein